jgi:hypothetical protein
MAPYSKTADVVPTRTSVAAKAGAPKVALPAPGNHPRPRSVCPYHYGYGTGLDWIAPDEVLEAKSFQIRNRLIQYIIGAGQLYARSDRYPFSTFCRDDLSAISSDWSAVGLDLWQGILETAKFRHEPQPACDSAMNVLRSALQELFAKTERVTPAQEQNNVGAGNEKQLELFNDKR